MSISGLILVGLGIVNLLLCAAGCGSLLNFMAGFFCLWVFAEIYL